MNDLLLKNYAILTREEHELVLSWRNTERVREMMSSMDAISMDEHLAFVARLPQMRDRRYYLAYVGDRPVGVVDLTYMTEDGTTCNPGLFTGEGSPMGTGLLLEVTAFHGLFDRFGYKTGWSLVKMENADYSAGLLRIFKMERHDNGDGFWKHVFQRETWQEVGEPLMKRIYARFKVSRVVWRDPDGETVSRGGSPA